VITNYIQVASPQHKHAGVFQEVRDGARPCRKILCLRLGLVGRPGGLAEVGIQQARPAKGANLELSVLGQWQVVLNFGGVSVLSALAQNTNFAKVKGVCVFALSNLRRFGAVCF